jgi:hypothetical protein
MTLRALALGAAIGFVVAVAPSCGPTKPPVKCNSASCQGCCDENDQCFEGVSPQACGIAAATCQVCTANQVCSQGQCRNPQPDGGGGGGAGGGSGGGDGGTGCNATNCSNGCCTAAGACQTNTSAAACGKNGASCTACQFGQACTAGVCTGTTCATCRDGLGNCLPDAGNINAACGKNGGLCVSCNTASGQSCNNGQCVGGTCDSVSCGDGCCVGTGASATCVRDGGIAQCGTSGAACQSCQGGAQCVTGQCQGGGSGDGGIFPNLDGGLGMCDATSCPTGCCALGLICQAGDTAFACGKGGVECVICLTQGKFTCDATSRTCQ